MQKLDRLSKLGIVAIVVLVVFGGAGIWWWSQQPLDTAKADPPPTPTASQAGTPPASPMPTTPSVDSGEDPEIAEAFKTYVTYEETVEQMFRDGGSEPSRQLLYRITTADGPERERVEDLVSQARGGQVRLLDGKSQLVRREVATATPGPDELVFTACWDGRSLKVEGSEPIPFLKRVPTMRKSDGQWLVHDVHAEQVEKC